MNDLINDIITPAEIKLRIEVVRGNIVDQDVDAIVNAAHEGLCGGGGVDGAIHKAAGSMMTGECMNLPQNIYGDRCPVGEVRMTGGYDLPAKYILHTVGPVWRGGGQNEVSDLDKCYGNALFVANMQGLQSVAFPNISTGAFAFPKDIAAQSVICDTIPNWITRYTSAWRDIAAQTVNLIRFVCFDQENYQAYLNYYPEGSVEYVFPIKS